MDIIISIIVLLIVLGLGVAAYHCPKRRYEAILIIDSTSGAYFFEKDKPFEYGEILKGVCTEIQHTVKTREVRIFYTQGDNKRVCCFIGLPFLVDDERYSK